MNSPHGQRRSGPSRPRLEAKAWTLEAKAWSLEAKAKDIHFCPRGSSRPRPGLEDYITGYLLTNSYFKARTINEIPDEVLAKVSLLMELIFVWDKAFELYMVLIAMN